MVDCEDGYYSKDEVSVGASLLTASGSLFGPSMTENDCNTACVKEADPSLVLSAISRLSMIQQMAGSRTRTIRLLQGYGSGLKEKWKNMTLDVVT